MGLAGVYLLFGLFVCALFGVNSDCCVVLSVLIDLLYLGMCCFGFLVLGFGFRV